MSIPSTYLVVLGLLTLPNTGLIIGPYLADFLGRKWTIEIGCAIVVIAGIVQAAAIDVHMFTAARFLSTCFSLVRGSQHI